MIIFVIFRGERQGDVMVTKRDLIVSVVLTFCLTSMMFIIAETKSASPYNPWADINGDGKVDPEDLVLLASCYGTSGTPINRTEILLNLGTYSAYSTPDINPSTYTTEYVYPKTLSLNLTEVYILQGQGWENETGMWGAWNTYGRNVTYTLSLNMIFFDAYPTAIGGFNLVLYSNGVAFGNPQLSVQYTFNSVQSVTVNGEGCLYFWIVAGLNNTVNWLDTSAFGNVEIASLST